MGVNDHMADLSRPRILRFGLSGFASGASILALISLIGVFLFSLWRMPMWTTGNTTLIIQRGVLSYIHFEHTNTQPSSQWSFFVADSMPLAPSPISLPSFDNSGSMLTWRFPLWILIMFFMLITAIIRFILPKRNETKTPAVA